MKKTGLILGALALTATGLYVASSKVSAYRGDPSVKGPNYSEERHQQMTQAFDNKDYEAWKKLMDGRGKVNEVVTKDNFIKFAQAHKLMLDGKVDEARKIRAEFGLGQGRHGQDGQGMGKQGMGQHRYAQ